METLATIRYSKNREVQVKVSQKLNFFITLIY